MRRGLVSGGIQGPNGIRRHLVEVWTLRPHHHRALLEFGLLGLCLAFGVVLRDALGNHRIDVFLGLLCGCFLLGGSRWGWWLSAMDVQLL